MLHCRYAARRRWTSRLLQRALFRSLERGGTLALAFYHSHESAARDIGKYERYEERPSDDGVSMEADNLLEKMKRRVTKQVQACLMRDALIRGITSASIVHRHRMCEYLFEIHQLCVEHWRRTWKHLFDIHGPQDEQYLWLFGNGHIPCRRLVAPFHSWLSGKSKSLCKCITMRSSSCTNVLKK